jgi:hypothetical protein
MLQLTPESIQKAPAQHVKSGSQASPKQEGPENETPMERSLTGDFPSTSMLQQGGQIQPKLEVGATDDPLEQEADDMASKVMRKGADGVGRTPMSGAVFEGVSDQSNAGIQRKCADCEEEKVQKKSQSGSGGGYASPQVTSQIQATKGGGQALDGQTRGFMENGFGMDLGHVKVHTGGYAASMSRELGAKAFTIGNDIYFNENQYAPHSESGRHLLAHELTHTVQQSGKIGAKKIQRISVTTTTPTRHNPCGAFTRSFIFTLDNPAPTDGYMVQKITRYDHEVACPRWGQCPANPSMEFYEAFFVQSGSTDFYRQAALGMTDQSGHATRPGTAGARYAHGEIRFFPIATTGNLGRNNTAGLWMPGNAGGVAASLSLPSTLTQPIWWNSHTEGPARRYVNADWRCCGDAYDYNTLSANP